jgi:thiol-disulfide isomerase/thioredoxin
MDAHPAVSEPARRRSPRLLAAAVALAVAGSIAAAASGAPTSSSLNLQGKDVRTGKPVSLAGDAGKPVVVNLWSSSCGACFADARALASFEHAHPAARVLGVDVADSAAGARSLYKRAGWRHPSIADPSGRIAAQLKMTTLPTTLFLNAKHEIVERINGQTTVTGFATGYRKASA